jgi:Tfp pilus assembly protein PilO
MNQKLSKEQIEKFVLIGVGAVIILIALFYFIFAPALRKTGELKNKIAQQKEKIVSAENDISVLPKTRANLAKLEEKMSYDTADMPQPTPDWFLDKLNSIAGGLGINFDKIEPKGVTKSGKYSLQEMEVELSTDYHSLGKFINKLENSSPFLKIIDISIMANKDNPLKHNVILKIGAYFNEEK